MNWLRNITLMVVTFFITITLIQNNLYIRSNAIRNPIEAAVLLYSFDDKYISAVKQSLENIQQRNENEIKFTFYDARKNQAIQDETIDTVIRNNFNLILLNLVDTKVTTVENAINKIKQTNIPVILFNVEPPAITSEIKSYKKAVILSTDAKQSGILQGELVVDEWNKNKSHLDKNGDNMIQYIMLRGDIDNVASIERTNSSISTIKNSGIKLQELASPIASWNEESAKNAIESLFLKYDGNIEVIISNNDEMAIGAIDALQKYGYNKGNKTPTIPVFGIDGISAAKDLIQKGIMAGTVIQDPDATAEALYNIGLNLVYNKDPLEDTNYKFDETGIVVRLPYSEYTHYKNITAL